MTDWKKSFLKSSVLGQSTNKCCPSEVIIKCIELAYSDMMTAGRYYSASFPNDKKEICSATNSAITESNFVFSRKIIKDNSFGFSQTVKTNSFNDKEMKAELKKIFSPELINRIDEIITFDMLDEESLIKIADLELKKLTDRCAELGINLSYTPEVSEKLSHDGCSKEYGAREIPRIIRRKIENLITDEFFSQIECKSLLLSVSNGEFNICNESKLRLNA